MSQWRDETQTPLEAETDIGPKVNRQELEKVDQYVQKAIADGTRALTGGNRLEGAGYEKGHWHQPTVLVDVRQEMDIMHQEIFGPVILF